MWRTIVLTLCSIAGSRLVLFSCSVLVVFRFVTRVAVSRSVSRKSGSSSFAASAKGSFEVSEGPDWGWRTTIILKSSDSFTFEMYNITPEGQEHLGVQVEYSKNNI